jgi:hypothetical protein
MNELKKQAFIKEGLVNRRTDLTQREREREGMKSGREERGERERGREGE